jgi:hypothetical protein
MRQSRFPRLHITKQAPLRRCRGTRTVSRGIHTSSARTARVLRTYTACLGIAVGIRTAVCAALVRAIVAIGRRILGTSQAEAVARATATDWIAA